MEASFYTRTNSKTPGGIGKTNRGDGQDYLLTPDVIKNKLFSQEIRFGILQFAQSKSEELIFLNNKTLKDWLELAGINGLPEKIEGQVDDFIEKQFVSFKHTLSTKSIEEVLPEDITKTINQKVPELVTTSFKEGKIIFYLPKEKSPLKIYWMIFFLPKGQSVDFSKCFSAILHPLSLKFNMSSFDFFAHLKQKVH